jgi:hypothetical protein
MLCNKYFSSWQESNGRTKLLNFSSAKNNLFLMGTAGIYFNGVISITGILALIWYQPIKTLDSLTNQNRVNILYTAKSLNISTIRLVNGQKLLTSDLPL